jgi:hypothetical protein
MRRTCVVTRIEQDWAADVLTAFTAPGGPGLQPAAGEVDYLKAFRRMRGGSTALAAFGMRLGVWLVAFAPLLLLGRLATFSGLARPEQSALLARMLVHKHALIRELTMLLKMAAAMALLGTASVRARSGYDATQVSSRADSSIQLRLPVVRRDHSEPVEPIAS